MKFGKIETFESVPFYDLPETVKAQFNWAGDEELFFNYNGDWMPLSDFAACEQIEVGGVKFHAVQCFSYYNALYITISDDYESVSAVYAYW